MFIRYKGLLNNLVKRSLKWNREIVSYTSQSQIVISDPAVQRYLEQIHTTYSRQTTPNHLRLLINSFSERMSIIENIKNLEDLQSQDTKNDMKDLLKEEKEMYENSLKIIDREILERMFPEEITYGESECILEINAGVGGQEAMLFGGELLNMYLKYSASQNWSATVIEADVADETGGLRHASIMITGRGAFETLSNEAGVHRVQRVPETEKSGRLHTSTVSVAVLLQPSEIEIHLPDKDLRIETKRSSGAGGQHVNKTESCVRITHLPTGISVECQAEREQLKNKRFAFARLRALLYEKQLNEQIQKTKDAKKSQIGSALRNEKIRTYNFNQDRVTDHRIGGSAGTVHDIKGLLEAGPSLNSLVLRLQNHFYSKNIIEKIELCRKEIESSQKICAQ